MKLTHNQIVVCTGQRGYGKTTLEKHLVRQLMTSAKVLVFDTMNEWQGFPRYVPKHIPTNPHDQIGMAEFEAVAKKVWSRGQIFFVVSEADLYMNAWNISPFAFKISGQGRHRGCGLLLDTRRIAQLHKYPCSQAHHWFIFRTFLPNDAKYLRAMIGDIGDKARNLLPFQFIHWDGREGKVCQPIPL